MRNSFFFFLILSVSLVQAQPNMSIDTPPLAYADTYESNATASTNALAFAAPHAKSPLVVEASEISQETDAILLDVSWNEYNSSLNFAWGFLDKNVMIKVYAVEYSLDGENYKTIGTVNPSKIGTNRWRTVNYTAGYNYYRIVAFTENNERLISKPQKIDAGDVIGHQVLVSNPVFERKTYVKVQTEATQNIKIEIYDINGERMLILYNGIINPNEPITKLFDGSTLLRGKYYITVVGENFKESKAVVLNK